MGLQVESLERRARANNFDFAAWEAERGLRIVVELFQLFLAELSVPHLQPFVEAALTCVLALRDAGPESTAPWQHFAEEKMSALLLRKAAVAEAR